MLTRPNMTIMVTSTRTSTSTSTSTNRAAAMGMILTTLIRGGLMDTLMR